MNNPEDLDMLLVTGKQNEGEFDLSNLSKEHLEQYCESNSSSDPYEFLVRALHCTLQASNEPHPKYNRKFASYLVQLMYENRDDEWLPVFQRILTHPDEITFSGKSNGQNALHAACIRYPPPHIVDAMLRAKPEAASAQNYAGETPLHMAAFSSSEEVQALIIRTKPSCVSIVDKCGDCPLHFAARDGATYQLLELFLQAGPETVSLRNKRGVTPFWVLPRSYLEAESLEDIFDEDEAEDYKKDWDLMCLFLRYAYFGANAVHFDPRVAVETDFLSNYRWLVEAAAATPACPRDTLKFLCRMLPDQALRYNSDGFTPLLLASRAIEVEEPKDWNETEDGFREHVEISYGQLQNDDQQLPEEAALLTVGDTEFLHQAVQGDEHTEREACFDEKPSVIDILIEWSPASVTYADGDGRLPLAHALLSGKSWKVVRSLIAACPRSLECRDRVTGMYMFQLAAENSPDLDTVYTIVRSLPLLVTQAATPPESACVSQPRKKQKLDSVI